MSAIPGVANPNAIEAMRKAKAERGIVGGAKLTITPQVIDKANAYVNGGYEATGAIIPTVEGLARHLKMHRSTMYEAKGLADTLEELQVLQAEMVLNRSLNNEYNPSIAKLILSAKHGYVERTEVAQTHSIVAEPQMAIATDFSAYVKSKTVAVEGELTTPTLPDSTD